MDAPSSEKAYGESGIEPPGLFGAIVSAEVFSVGTQGSRTEPHLVVEVGRHGNDLCGAAWGATRRPNVDVFELTDFAAAHQLAREPEKARGTLLRAKLENPLVAVNFFAQGDVFAHGEAQRLFDINVFASTDGSDANRDVPVVGGGNEASVDVLPGEQLAEITVS